MPPKNTTQLLQQLRLMMQNTSHVPQSLSAYIIPSEDAHQSEYVAARDQRRAYISGFTGSFGTAVVTLSKAALWTDSRYFLQAEKELDENWILMKQGLDNTPTMVKWLSQVLDVGSTVGADPFLHQAGMWNELSNDLKSAGHSLIPVTANLIDLIWPDQPPRSANPVFPLEIKFTGATPTQKIVAIQKELEEHSCSTVVITALDDVAYLFNLRGSDIRYMPVFFAYGAVTTSEAFLFIDEKNLTPAAVNQLKSEKVKISILPYDGIINFIEKQQDKVWIPASSSYALANSIPNKKKLFKPSPVAAMKAVKNETEIAGLRASHIRDAAALCRYLAWLEKEVPKGTQTELSGAEQLEKFRQEQENYVSLSFNTVSSVGPNASIVHYASSPETDRLITTEEIYLCDSGGQYKDGTTDVTRTVHFGMPSQFQKECFTRVLKGQIAIATSIFPSSTKGNHIDVLARKALWDVGLDYGHGTGHGIGMYLCVHEGPMGISRKIYPDDPGLKEGMFLSDEPGYYEDGKFGIRLENIVQVVKAKTRYNHSKKDFLTFSTVTLVPVQMKLIETSLLTAAEVEWLNAYHMECREKVGSLLLQQGHKDVYDWLVKQTEPIG